MTDRYWRKIEDVENDIENAMQISSILLKLKGYDDKLSNLEKISDNNNNISTNSGQISANKNDISSNSGLISTNKNDISTNSGRIITNTNNISTNSGQISTNTSSISSNLGKIDDNINAIKLIIKNSQDNSKDISNNKGLIETNTGTISTNSEKIDNFTQYILKSGKDFEKKYIIEKQIFRFNRNKHFYTLFEKEIEYNFTKNSLLFVKNNMYYKYDNLSKDYHRLQHEYNIYDDENNLIHKYLFNKDTYYDESPILHTNEDFCICFKKNYNKIKINLQLHRHNRHGVGNINLEIDDDNENYINIDYLDRNNNANTESISTNLEKINNIENNLIVFDNIYNKTFTIGNFTSISNTIIFFYETINFNFTTNGIIKIDAKYSYFENYNLTHIYKFYKNKKIFKEIKLDNISNIVNDKFEIQAIDSTAIDIGIFYETNTGGNKEIKLVGDNICQVSYFDNITKTNKNKLDISSNLSKIDGNINAIKLINKNSQDNSKDISTNKGLISTNKSDISTNLIKINSNEDDILYNLNEINNIKNNSSKSYLKNVYNILFYNKKTQVSFRNYFFEKVFDVNASINDFVEMSFKISLEYENISERSYVKTLYELFDENDNSLYIKSVSNNDYSYYSNKIFIDENIFYNFNKSIKKIKFVIKFQMILSRVIKIWYIKNDNYRLTIKNYGL